MADTEVPAGFGSRLHSAASTYAALCAGIDPHPRLLESWGLPVSVDGLTTFTMRCVEAFAGHVAAVKPQVAFYEAYGAAGFAVLEKAFAELADSPTQVIADAKRGDIGSTMAAYAAAWLADSSPLAADAVTVSPYLGFGSLAPAVEMAQQTGRGLFVLAATSNPDGPSVQRAEGAGGRRTDQLMVDQAAEINKAYPACQGPVGVVLGATVTDPPEIAELNAAVLLPGVGAQGATLADVSSLTKNKRVLSLPSVSRSLLHHGPDVADLRKAVKTVVGE
ncbi:orotidine-5'-phosphate decarboxylase [Corynebacterium mendelii]|uniref:Orotidine-5'-phosphate decarboxylase n=1 Tax=Corynebacterium mendelii TaxID=2765362 RepID=A0A939DY75_9CORY|nr:orotidine-5'-phosphate decarboxylase [Corynebacterium mendelii]MBN9643420.1 orotidine-5'-phosphate decarboxylase [Corynebacterium mendelii]